MITHFDVCRKWLRSGMTHRVWFQSETRSSQRRWPGSRPTNDCACSLRRRRTQLVSGQSNSWTQWPTWGCRRARLRTIWPSWGHSNRKWLSIGRTLINWKCTTKKFKKQWYMKISTLLTRWRWGYDKIWPFKCALIYVALPEPVGADNEAWYTYFIVLLYQTKKSELSISYSHWIESWGGLPYKLTIIEEYWWLLQLPVISEVLYLPTFCSFICIVFAIVEFLCTAQLHFFCSLVWEANV